MKDELQNNILPDEEDLTLKDNLIKLKDRSKDPNKHTGKGYKILRLCAPDCPTGNILLQSDIMDTNTIYEVRYDFDLNQQTIVIPENCVLYINGGSFDNGTLFGNNTIIVNYNLLSLENINFNGIFITDSVYIEADADNNIFDIKYKDFNGIEHKIYNIFNIVQCYKESVNKPNTPNGGKIDENGSLIPPENWSSSFENMINNVWMSTGRFNQEGNLIGEWSEPVNIISSRPIFKWYTERENCNPTNIGKILISYDGGLTWKDLSDAFTNNLYVKGIVPVVDNLPTLDSVLGDIYAVGPFFAEGDIEQENPSYTLYIYNYGKWVNFGSSGSASGGSGTVGNGTIVVQDITDLDDISNLLIGQFVYVINTDELLFYNNDNQWQHINEIIVSTEEPEDKTVLWIDPDGDAILNQEGNLTSIRQSIKTLEDLVAKLMNILNYGAIAGDSTIGARTIIMDSAEPIDPNENTSDDEIEPIEPDKKALLNTLPNISIKIDTLANFKLNVRNLIDGELIWISDLESLYIYINNKFIPISNSEGGNIPGGDDMTQEDIEKLYFNHLGFVNSNNEQYKLQVNENGNIIVYNAKNYDGNIGNAGNYGSYISDYLRINSIFIGGISDIIDHFSACSHNFVELANASTKDINLNGIYLLYKKPGANSWESIALKGTIKAGSTFLIRGERCAYKSNVTLDVDDYDMQWYTSDKNLIKFEEGGGCFYLVCSNEGKFNNGSDWVTLEEFGSVNPYNADKAPNGYIDLVGVKSSKTSYTIHAEGGSPIAIKDSEDIRDCIFVRSFTLDPCSQAQKAQNSKKSSALWTYVNMNTVGSDQFPYYSSEDKHKFVPKASKYNKSIYGTRTTFVEDAPNMVNITFGILATDNGSTKATRCFNWISLGYYDEYIEYKKKSEEWESAKSKKSISLDNYETEYSGDTNVAKFIKVYNRIKWITTNRTAVTTHKVIIRGLDAGEYSYRVRRVGDDNYMSPEYNFTVRTDSDVNSSFSFAHTTDQQAFNFYEYQAWSKAAYAINTNHSDILFTINTGDITQNGNRESEWLDYYEGRRFLRNKEEMFTIGNNDLCGIIPYELGDGTAGTYKINHKNIQYYYMFECDENNPQYFKYIDTEIDETKVGDVIECDETSFTYYMPSVYSFNYGNYHFIALNSEFAANTYKVYYNDSDKGDTIKQHAYYNMYKWLEKDIQLYPDKNYIAFMHEIPFCIVVGDSITAVAVDRTETNGSKLNNDFSNGKSKSETASSDKNVYTGGCCFSEFFLNNKIKLALGGHKHTYSLSYPTKENISNANQEGRTVNYKTPSVDKSGNDGVVYAMCQATGYKLVSNKELPGTGIDWLRKYFPMSTSGASLSQYYPMYSVFTVTSNNVKMESYTVYNIYYEDGSKQTAFNINNQRTEFTTKNSTPIQLDTTNNYINIVY